MVWKTLGLLLRFPHGLSLSGVYAGMFFSSISRLSMLYCYSSFVENLYLDDQMRMNMLIMS